MTTTIEAIRKAWQNRSQAQEDVAVLAALGLLGVDEKVRYETNPDTGTTEIWLAAESASGDEGGFKFTFKEGRLTGIHIRALPDHDITKSVGEKQTQAIYSKPQTSTVQ